MAKVSVIVPVYNIEKYLVQCLDSVVSQTLKDIEIIIVDDGSTDNCPKICDNYAQNDSRIKVLHLENGGLGKAYNAGLDVATGEYIGFIESDDYAELNMFEELYNLAEKFNADVVKSDWYNYWSKRKIRNFKRGLLSIYPNQEIINVEKYPQLVCVQSSIWSAIYKKSFLRDFNIRFLETPGASYQDASFALKTTASAKRFVVTHDAYVHYRQDNENSSVKSRGKVYAICEEYDEIDKYLENHKEIKNFVEQHKWIHQYYLYQWNLSRIAKNFHKEFLNYYAETFKKAYEQNKLNEVFFGGVSEKQFYTLIYSKKIIKVKKDYGLNIFQKIFSVKNIKECNKKIKMITIFGYHFKWRIL